ncbi:MAG: type II toxin-antitoxin system HicB family antitoxin [Flexilinea sp.]|nr:type II toxin-antitoxin system HicB family antitoxin [Flexilinea sp.]
MKSVDDYMKLPYKMEIVEDTDEGGYIASYPELKGCITCGETIEQVVSMAIDAKKAWLEAAVEDRYDIPLPETENQYSGQFKFRMPRSLHRELAEHAKAEGISMNQYCIYLLSKNDAVFQSAKAI